MPFAFRPTTVKSRFRLAIAIFAAFVFAPAVFGWWSLRKSSAAADRSVIAAVTNQDLSLRLVSATMLAVRAGNENVVRPAPHLDDEFRRWSAEAHAAARAMNQPGVATSAEATFVARLDRELSILESSLARAHREVELGDTAGARRDLAAAAPLQAALLADVGAMGNAETSRLAATTTALRRSADARLTRFFLVVLAAMGGLIVLARWVSLTIARPLGRLLHHANELSLQQTGAHTAPDTLPEEFRPLATAMNDAGTTLKRVAQAEAYAQHVLACQTSTLQELKDRTAELEVEVAARRSAELAAREARHRADAANRAKSDFLARMSHELRTPLNSVIGFANVLTRNRAGNLRPSDLEYVDRIASNGNHLLELIDEVLDLAKVESGRMTADFESTDLGTLVRDTIADMEGRLLGQSGDVQLRVEVPAQLMPIVADRTRLKQMLINLVGNALKFTAHGSVTARVVVDPATHIPTRIEVIDTGPGVPLERQEAIFEAFEQASNSTSRQYGGTGLGLAITRAFADLLGYSIELESTLAVGSTFSIVLNPAPKAPREVADVERQGAVESGTVAIARA
ncbi:MAG: ATP-binding protein [bacterium]